MDLYTSLTRLKQELNDGALPRMTAIPKSSLAVIDPAFTIGYGAMAEDIEKGLRCPVRGCGVYRHQLTTHLNSTHRDIGGARTVRRLLSIPDTAPLYSRMRRAELAALMLQKRADGRCVILAPRGMVKSQKGKRKNYGTMGSRNLRKICDEQLIHALVDLENRLGRAPTGDEFVAEYDRPKLDALVLVFGTWRSALLQCGLENLGQYRRHREGSREAVLAALDAWYTAHDTLPSSRQADNPRSTPALPRYGKILRALQAENWPEAMQRAASLLNIYGGRYGLPIEHKPKEEAA